MDYLQAIILGLVQGITEFLPISSSAHLVLVPKLFGWEQQSLTFDIFVHSGTLVAIIYFYRKRLQQLITGFIKREKESLDYFKFIVMTTIPTLGIFLFAKDYLESTLQSLSVIVVALFIGGILLILADIYSKRMNSKKKLDYLSSGMIGVGQGASLIRGVSRSGGMLIVGLFMKVERKQLLEYVFIASIPVILAGLFLEVINYTSNGSAESLGILFAGFLSAFAAGLGAINLLNIFLNKNILIYSGIYRIVLAILIWLT